MKKVLLKATMPRPAVYGLGLVAEMDIASLRGNPARSIFRTADRRRSWEEQPWNSGACARFFPAVDVRADRSA